jgi:magnesium transporter
MDSIVDSFFPILDHIEVEAADMILTETQEAASPASSPRPSTSETTPRTSDSENSPLVEKTGVLQSPSLDEKGIQQKDGVSAATAVAKARFALPAPAPSMVIRHWKRSISRFILRILERLHPPMPVQTVNPTTANLRRMARTRHLVTTLGRVLSTKGELVGRLRKRLLTPGEHGIGQEDIELAIYMGDVQGLPTFSSSGGAELKLSIDHILSIAQSLSHYERVLSQSQQTYLQHLRTVVSRGRANQDMAVLILSIVTVGVLPLQMIMGTSPRSQTYRH